MRVERAAPTEMPGEVLDRVLDKGIISLRLGEAPIELIARDLRVVVESPPDDARPGTVPARAA